MNGIQKSNKLKEYKKTIIIIIIVCIAIICVAIGIKVMNNTRNVSISDVDNVLENVMEDDENEILNEDNNIEVEENTEDINDNSSINENTSSDVNNDMQEGNESTTDNNSIEKYDNKIEKDDNKNNTEESKSQEDYSTTVQFSSNELENKTEEELIKLFKDNGLTPKVTKITKEIPYLDELANKTVVTNIQSDFGYYYYNKGDTVNIQTTYYKPVAWETSIYYSASGASFEVNGKTYSVDSNNSGYYEGIYCFITDPIELDSYFLYGTNNWKGVEFYIDNKLMGRGTKGYYDCTFNDVDTITYKIVAPYVYEYGKEILDGVQGTMIGTNVVVYEKELNLKDLYKNMRGDTIDLEL